MDPTIENASRRNSKTQGDNKLDAKHKQKNSVIYFNLDETFGNNFVYYSFNLYLLKGNIIFLINLSNIYKF